MAQEIATKISRGTAIDNHGLNGCPHTVNVYFTVQYSNNMSSNGNQVVRKNDRCIHDGPHPGSGYIITGANKLSNNSIPVARKFDRIKIQIGDGYIIAGTSQNFTSN